MGLGQHFTRAHVTLTTLNDKDVAHTCRFGNSHFQQFFCSFVNAIKTIGYSKLLMSKNIILTFEYFSIKDLLNNLGNYKNGLHLAEL